jgi:hypothetical protein
MVHYLVIVSVIFALLAVLILYQIYRWYHLYIQSQKYKVDEGKAKILKTPVPRYQLSYGSSYLMLETKTTESYKLFSNYITGGSKGLLITRVFPARIKKQYNLGQTPVLWLSRTQAGKAINPTNLGVLLEEARDFISENKKTLLLLDGLEYLIIENDFERVLKFINSLEDEIALHNSRLVVSVNPKVLDAEKKALLEKTMKVLADSEKPARKKAIVKGK